MKIIVDLPSRKFLPLSSSSPQPAAHSISPPPPSAVLARVETMISRVKLWLSSIKIRETNDFTKSPYVIAHDNKAHVNKAHDDRGWLRMRCWLSKSSKCFILHFQLFYLPVDLQYLRKYLLRGRKPLQPGKIKKIQENRSFPWVRQG